jgi:membrane associated rhomboid family serine protease
MGLGDRDYMRSGQPVGVSWGKDGPKSRRQWSVLSILIAINIGIFVLQFLFQLLGDNIPVRDQFGAPFVDRYGEEQTEFRPWGGASAEKVFENGHVWTLFTYMFVHGGFLHILVNLILIVACGRALQVMLGEKHLLQIFLFAGLFGGLAQILFSLLENPSIPVVGASACAFGLLVALAVLIPEQEVSMLLFFVIPLRLRMKYLASSLVGLAVVFLVIDLMVSGNVMMVSGVGHAAHLGGALAGWIYIRMAGAGGRAMKQTLIGRRQGKSAGRAHGRSAVKGSKIVSTTLVKEVDGVVIETDEFAMNRIDDLLEKISEQGMGNLTEQERKVLEEYSRRISGGIK